MDDDGEKKLLIECQNGSQTAFKQLVELYYKDAYAMALMRTHNREVALDISQEAFIRVFRNIKKFDFGHSFKAWLYTIVKNLSLNYLQRHRKRFSVFSDLFGKRSLKEQPDNNTIEFLERKELRSLLQKMMKKLNSREREIILLRDFEDFSYQEISELLEIPMGTVMSRLYHARKKLATFLEEYEHEFKE